jgi:thiol:disulfide interchange protein DsbD
MRTVIARLLLLALTAVLTTPLGATAASPGGTSTVKSDQVRAELVAHAPQGVAPGKPVWLGLAIEHQPHWHTYWKNPGDSGLPTTLQWQLPAGFVAGDVQWPTPQRLPVGPLVNYGYEGSLLLPVKLTVPADFAGDTLAVKLHAEWLACKEVCIPESGDFALAVPAHAAWSGQAALFDAAVARQPQTIASAQARAEVTPQALVVSVTGLPAAWQGQVLSFFPETAGVIENAATTTTAWKDGRWTAQVPLATQRSESPKSMAAVLTAAGQPAGVRLEFAVAGTWPAIETAPAGAPEAAATTPAAPAAASLSLVAALLFALVGGAILNLMPCVFPVLSLKVLGFASHADDRRGLALGGLAYTAGVVVSFVALAALLLALRAGGEQLGWGFQLQSPAVIAVLAALFTLIGLNLAGLFEFGSVLPSSLASLQLRHPLVDAALTGVLAVAVASPCTAPFMGASLGLAVTLPTGEALAIFAALGLGMALPYLVFSLWPALARALPRPGAWMAVFRSVMAFPMFATVVWLVWVFGQQTGMDAVAALLSTLVALAFVAWALAAPGIAARARAVLGVVALASFVAALSWMIPALATSAIAGAHTDAAAAPGEKWQPWSAEKVAQLRAEGRPVFVDFTAAWCVTCQYNKRTTLAKDEVLKDFEGRNVALLRADWTRRDATITAELARLGRNGVPVYVLYAPGTSAPQVLSEVLSVADVRGALAKL